MKVPFLDLKGASRALIDQFDRAIREVIESSAFAGGPFVEQMRKGIRSLLRFEICHRIRSDVAGRTYDW